MNSQPPPPGEDKALDPNDEESSLGVNDGRDLFSPKSKWPDAYRTQQRHEAIYVVALLAASIVLTGALGLAVACSDAACACSTVLGFQWPTSAVKYGLLGAGGLLGGTVYGAKWLYHSVAKGLWHADRRLWRYMQPWISLGTTVGIWALIDSGFFPNAPDNISMLGIGFVVGYLSDQFLAKMKEMTSVLFGRAERHHGHLSKDGDRDQPP